jgi:dinuclear metal center YbgI/SA1388 family protein
MPEGLYFRFPRSDAPGTDADESQQQAPSAALSEVVAYLDTYLRLREIPDEANAVNGLQVENAGRIGSIVAAVDATQATIDGVVREWLERRETGAAPPLVVVHHGLFWDGNQPVTGRRYRRLRALLDHDVALYAAHIPLDVHPEVGNNVVLARRLGVDAVDWFGSYRGVPVGVWGHVSPRGDVGPHAADPPGAVGPHGSAGLQGIPRDEFVSRIDSMLETTARCIPGGPERIERVGIATGAASRELAAARDLGLDTFVTGEGPHHTYFDAMEWGVNLIYAGHYATEQVGVQALAEHLGLRFQLPWEFHWHPTGL